MPNVRMPNGDVVAFPDDMPKEQIKSLIASKFPELAKPQQAEASPQEDQPGEKPSTMEIARDLYEATTPIGMAQRMGRKAGEFLVDNGPDIAKGVWDSAKSAVTAPMRAITGELRMTDDAGRTSPEAIQEAFNMATWVTPSSPANGTLAQTERLYNATRPTTEGENVAQAASRAGVELPRAVVSDNAVVNQLGKTTANVPIAGRPLRKASEKAISQLDDAAKNVQDTLGSGSREVAGNKIAQDMAKFAKTEEPAALKALYSKVDDLVDPNVRVQMSETAKVAADIVKSRAAADATESKAVDRLRAALMNRSGKSYAELKTLREDFRAIKSDKGLMANLGMNERDVNRLYDALSADLRSSTKAAGGDEALKAFNEANNRAAVFARDKEAINAVLGKGSNENMASRLAALASDNSRANVRDLMLVRSKVSKETWNELASTVVDDLSRNPATGKFTPDKFVTKWNKLSTSGKKLLFDEKTRSALEDIATVSTRFKQMNQYANPSGTGQTLLTGALGGIAYVDPMTALQVAVPTYAVSKWLASPVSARAVADYAKAYELAAKSPSTLAQNNLASKAMRLAMIAANGNERAASNLAARMASVQQTAADEANNEVDGRPVSNPERWKADEDLNQAVLEGRGA